MSSFLTIIFLLIVSNALGIRFYGRAGFLNHDNETICYGKLGCLVTTDEWYDVLHRPLNLKPGSRADINTTFTLYTRENMEGEIISVSENGEVKSEVYKAEVNTKFITHGFLSAGNADWVMDMMTSLLSRMDINVVAVDWSKGATFPYTQAVSNTRVVGLEIAYLVNTLIQTQGVSAGNFHLIGHSLGAQISGYAGERIKGLGRITGLDPAGPMFSGMPTFVRLDSSDAKFVDVIHTNTDLLGIKEMSGHLDFFPNGGGSQPGCTVITANLLSEAIAAFEDGPSCSHSRSTELFIESITSSPYFRAENESNNEKCPLIAFLCESYEDFVNGMCTSCGEDGKNCALMGLDAYKYPGSGILSEGPRNFYLKTNSNPPFCGFHYAANLTVASDSKGREHQVGEIYVDAYGDMGVARKMDLTENGARKMTKGNSYNFLGFSPRDAGKVSRVDMTWKWNPGLMDTCIFCVKDLFLSNLEFTNLGYYSGELFQTSTLCSEGTPTVVKRGSPKTLSLKC